MGHDQYGYQHYVWMPLLNHTPIFDWCVVQQESKNKHHKDTCFKEVGLSRNQGMKKYALLITTNRYGEV